MFCDLKNVQFWVKCPACHCHYLLCHPITMKDGRDKYHTEQPSQPTCTSAEQRLNNSGGANWPSAGLRVSVSVPDEIYRQYQNEK